MDYGLKNRSEGVFLDVVGGLQMESASPLRGNPVQLRTSRVFSMPMRALPSDR